ncbi:hypothetical protein C8R44DRAFT_733045 [Mycena epipterygia]|nr:hypothetical protein C8R44DRAFT_733045 [Mycena epipterygia]
MVAGSARWRDYTAVITLEILSPLSAVIRSVRSNGGRFLETPRWRCGALPDVAFRRVQHGAIAFSFLTRISILLYSYYIPIFSQAVNHSTVIAVGIDLLFFILSVALTSLLCGQLVSRTRYYWRFLAIAPIFLGTGSGLF